ncbi:lamin tail domain-containing protein [bacterium]|nr:lamin tail domain-containing protein [bacterium]MBU1983416.1 lamin tail domain-containing protein [bacterium]
MKLSKGLWMAALMGLLVLSGTASAAVNETFDGFTQNSYGVYTYNGFVMDSALCNAQGATACVNPLPSNTVRLRDRTNARLEYIGTDGNGKDGGVGTISFDYKSWDGAPASVYDVSVSINGGAYSSIGTINTTNCGAYEQFSYALNNASDNIKIRILYTSGERLHVDNYSITDYGADLIPPEIVSVTVLSATALDVLFNENVDLTTSEIEANYVVTPGSVSPSLALRDGANNALVHLTFAAAFSPGSYTLTVNGVRDLANNACSNETEPFFVNPTLTAGDVVINEVMYDDTASTDVEWVEIYNRTANAINIGGWTLQDDDVYPADGGEGSIQVPAGTILPASGYRVLSKVDLPEITGEIVCTQIIGSWILSNSGDNLALYTAASGGMLMDGALNSNYPALATANAGNSIEKCTENSPWSSDPSAWHESTNVFAATGRYRQCTPGVTNSICAPDVTPPEISYITVVSTTALDVMFNEDVEQTTSETEANYVVTPGSVSPSLALRDGANNALVHLTFAAAFTPNTYTLTVNNVEDLANNPCVNETGLFQITTLSYGDVVITEVMYDDTAALDSEWVEIHNTTANPIDISGWYLTDDDTYPTPSGEGGLIVPASTTLPAYGYLVLTRANQPELTGEIVCTMAGSFGLNNGGDNLALYTAATGGTLIDGSLSVDYPDLSTANMGYSIEKCDSTATWSGDPLAWHESTNNFGIGRYARCTPGAANSICVPDTDPPLLVSATGITAAIVEVEFNEAVGQTTAETVTNYSVTGVGNPSSAMRQANQALVRLTFSPSLSPDVYTLNVQNVADLAGNPMEGIQQDTFTIATAPANLIFTEIMPNPNFTSLEDSLGEWFEVYNAGATVANLTGWILEDNAGADTIEGSPTINPGEYFVFGSNGDSLLNGGVPVDYAYAFGTSGWGLSLANTGDIITIKDAVGTVVTTLTYTSTYPYGAGYSAQLKNLTYNPAIDTSWCRADTIWLGAWNGDKGTPGAATICAPQLPPQYRTLCDIREQDTCGIPTLLSQIVISQCVVTYMDSCRRNAYIELNGCGVMIYGNAVRAIMQNSTRLMRVGDFVEVNGYITHYNGLTEYAYYLATDPVVTFISAGNPIPNPVVVQPSAISTARDNCGPEPFESRRIAVPGVTFLAGNGDSTFGGGTSGLNYYAVSGTDTIVVRVVPCDSIVGDTIPVGPVSVMGLLSQYDNTGPCRCGGYQLMMAGANPFSVAVCATPIYATAYRMSGASADSVEIRWQPGPNQTCSCYRIYYSDTADAAFPGGFTQIGCVCGQTYWRQYHPAVSSRRFYLVTSDSSCP